MEPIDAFTDEYSFLSNFYPATVVWEGVEYATVEHAYQAAKTTDIVERLAIQACDSPGKAKRAGKRLALRIDWDTQKEHIMDYLLRQKFIKHPELTKKLLATGEAELIEGNYWGDVYWGVCLGKGENRLGKLLMQIRKELKEEVEGR